MASKHTDVRNDTTASILGNRGHPGAPLGPLVAEQPRPGVACASSSAGCCVPAGWPGSWLPGLGRLAGPILGPWRPLPVGRDAAGTTQVWCMDFRVKGVRCSYNSHLVPGLWRPPLADSRFRLPPRMLRVCGALGSEGWIWRTRAAETRQVTMQPRILKMEGHFFPQALWKAWLQAYLGMAVRTVWYDSLSGLGCVCVHACVCV